MFIGLNFRLIIEVVKVVNECLGFCLFVFIIVRWLQPDSYADPQKTSLILNKDDIRCGWPTTITVQTKDQYGDVVHVPNMKVIITIKLTNICTLTVFYMKNVLEMASA